MAVTFEQLIEYGLVSETCPVCEQEITGDQVLVFNDTLGGFVHEACAAKVQ